MVVGLKPLPSFLSFPNGHKADVTFTGFVVESQVPSGTLLHRLNDAFEAAESTSSIAENPKRAPYVNRMLPPAALLFVIDAAVCRTAGQLLLVLKTLHTIQLW
jgi:hypothetical protein